LNLNILQNQIYLETIYLLGDWDYEPENTRREETKGKKKREKDLSLVEWPLLFLGIGDPTAT